MRAIVRRILLGATEKSPKIIPTIIAKINERMASSRVTSRPRPICSQLFCKIPKKVFSFALDWIVLASLAKYLSMILSYSPLARRFAKPLLNISINSGLLPFLTANPYCPSGIGLIGVANFCPCLMAYLMTGSSSIEH